MLQCEGAYDSCENMEELMMNAGHLHLRWHWSLQLLMWFCCVEEEELDQEESVDKCRVMGLEQR